MQKVLFLFLERERVFLLSRIVGDPIVGFFETRREVVLLGEDNT